MGQELCNFKAVASLGKLACDLLSRGREIWPNDRWYYEVLKPQLDVIIVVGAWEGAELFDRPAAYAVMEELEKEGLHCIVMVDRYWWEIKHRYDEKAVVTVGGPAANSLSSEVAKALGLGRESHATGYAKLWNRVVGYAWGPDPESTLRATREFIEKRLKSFVDALRGRGTETKPYADACKLLGELVEECRGLIGHCPSLQDLENLRKRLKLLQGEVLPEYLRDVQTILDIVERDRKRRLSGDCVETCDDIYDDLKDLQRKLGC